MDQASAQLEVLAMGTPEMLCRPCVDCGRWTGRFCDYCFAKDRIPSEQWADNHYAPLCSHCESKWDACRFCRRVHACTPPAHGSLDADVDIISEADFACTAENEYAPKSG